MSRSTDKLRAWAEIDLGALERNLKTIRHYLPEHLKFISVVKADAYGHGLEPTVTRLMRSEADYFAVANLDEAARIKSVGSGWPTLVLSPLLKEEASDAVELGIIPIVSSEDECMTLNSAAKKQDKVIDIHLKIDTGMGRIGIWFEKTHDLIEKISSFSHLRFKGICTHFAAADSNPSFTQNQRLRFIKLLDSRIPWPSDFLIHADNSAGTENFESGGWFNATRIGILQFGIQSHSDSLFKGASFEPILSFRCKIGLIKNLPEETSISYGQTHVLKRSSRIGILTAGYADGIPITLSNRGSILVRGKHCPILGRVTMDQTIIDLSDVPNVETGDTATIIGKSDKAFISAESVAKTAESISWQVLCGISDRVARIYKRDSTL